MTVLPKSHAFHGIPAKPVRASQEAVVEQTGVCLHSLPSKDLNMELRNGFGIPLFPHRTPSYDACLSGWLNTQPTSRACEPESSSPPSSPSQPFPELALAIQAEFPTGTMNTGENGSPLAGRSHTWDI
jgi:hypothetical protein